MKTDSKLDDQTDLVDDDKIIELAQRALKFISIFAGLSILVYFVKFGTISLYHHRDVLAASGPLPWVMASLPSENATWGTFGDFLGGLFNPVIGLLTVYLLLANARMQKRELQNSIAEMRASNSALAEQANLMELQSIQNGLFNWLNHYREQLKYLSYTPAGSTSEVHGVAALRARFHYHFSASILSSALKDMTTDPKKFLNEFRETGTIDDAELAQKFEKILIERWRALYAEQHEAVHSALKALFSLISWIDMQPAPIMSPERKYEYVRIIESHLSSTELIYIFFIGWTVMAKPNIVLVRKYSLLNNFARPSKPNHLLSQQSPNTAILKFSRKLTSFFLI